MFINADAEYGEGRAQNYLRPEDLEKIIQVYRQHREIPRYSRLVTLDELAANDYNLNIRRYVDNSPEPEIEDVRAHLVGGVPKREVARYADQLARFGLSPEVVFVERDADYYDFRPEIKNKADIRPLIENHPNIKNRQAELEARLESWWYDAAKAIENFPGQNHLAEFRRHFQNTLRQALLPVGVLDEFQIAGIFANWWEAERYDFKTIVAAGWSPSLILDEYILNAFFQHEQAEIETLENRVGYLETELEEVLAEGELEDESERDEEDSTPNAGEVKQAIKNRIAEVKAAYQIGIVSNDVISLEKSLNQLDKAEKSIKGVKSEINRKKSGLQNLVTDRRKNLATNEPKSLILQRIHNVIVNVARGYFQNQLKITIYIFENFLDKYFTSLEIITGKQEQAYSTLDVYLRTLGYKN